MATPSSHSTAEERLVRYAREHGRISTDEAMRVLGISRATAHRRLRALVEAQRFAARGAGRSAHYVLAASTWTHKTKGLDEASVWNDVEPIVADNGFAPEERSTIGYTVTEMVNNAIDHSGSARVTVRATPSPHEAIVIEVIDRGVGVFARLRETKDVETDEEALALLEKGKQTTMPERHSGEGIFFSSKAAQRYRLEAGRLAWIVDNLARDTTVQILEKARKGTRVEMTFIRGAVPTLRDVFDAWTNTETRAFDRTKTSVKLAQLGSTLLARSQAKRVVVGLDKFAHVELDFDGVDLVGQGFVDEIFRVFANAHPAIELAPVRMNDSVAFMVNRGRVAAAHDPQR